MVELRNQAKNTAITYTVYLLYRDNILFCVALLWSAKKFIIQFDYLYTHNRQGLSVGTEALA